MVFVLLALCVLFSVLTVAEQRPTGADAGIDVAEQILAERPTPASTLIVVRKNQEDVELAATLEQRLRDAGWQAIEVVSGEPSDALKKLKEIAEGSVPLEVLAVSSATADWTVIEQVSTRFPQLRDVQTFQPQTYVWPNFLKRENLLNIANQIAVIAILAIGMTMVIITGGIDLSVGSLIALSAVIVSLLVRECFGATEASAGGITLAAMGAILACAAVGAFTGTMVTLFSVPPFIVTLAMMLVTSGAAYLVADGQSIYQVPDSFVWLGRGADLFGAPNAVLLMLLLYAGAHVLMSQMALGRFIYAVGGNSEAARLSGVPVRRVLLFVYTVCGALAGLGGVIMASQLKSGSPTYGLMYELYVIAAVVVGGTSLSGGSGRVLGTLIGALIIAVIQNGMNLTGVESYTQRVVLGLVILVAVLIDKLRTGGWKFSA